MKEDHGTGGVVISARQYERVGGNGSTTKLSVPPWLTISNLPSLSFRHTPEFKGLDG